MRSRLRLNFALNPLIYKQLTFDSFKMYRELIEALKEADSDPRISMCCITGAGDYYCSGNDLTNFQTQEAMTDIKKAARDGGLLLE